MNELRRVLGHLRPHLGYLIGSLGFMLLATPLELFHPLVWRYVIDEVVMGGKPDHLMPAVVAMFLVHFAGTTFASLRLTLASRAALGLVEDVRAALHAKLMGQGVAYHRAATAGDLNQRVMGDAAQLHGLGLAIVNTAMPHALQVAWVTGLLFWMSPELAVVSLAPLGLVILVIRVFNGRVQGIYRDVQESTATASSRLLEHLQGFQVLQAHAREAEAGARFREDLRANTRAGWRGALAGAFYMPSCASIGFLSNAVMVLVGVEMVLYGRLTLGTLVAFRGYWWSLFAPLFTLAQVNDQLQRARASARRVFEVLDAPVEIRDPPAPRPLPPPPHALRLEKVGFRHAGRDSTLVGIDLELPPGARLGVVGPSGAGKSTLLALLLRFHDPDRGRITLGGVDLHDLALADLRRHVGLVSQEPFLFNASVRENLRLARPGATDAELVEAARLAHADAFVRDLPGGYDAVVGERGGRLSGGQRQRLAVARAFLADPEVLLLDEATSAVEPEAEAVIQSALRRLMEGRTTVVVTHRMGLVKDCDEVLVLAGGEVVERGPPAALASSGGWFDRMLRLQVEEQRIPDVLPRVEGASS